MVLTKILVLKAFNNFLRKYLKNLAEQCQKTNILKVFPEKCCSDENKNNIFLHYR